MSPADPQILTAFDGPAQSGGILSMLPMMLAIAAIFYFIVYRPQKKEADEHAKLLASLVRGDRVITTAGLHGRVNEVKGDTVALEIAPNVVVTVERDVVRRKIEPPKAGETKGADAKGADAKGADAKGADTKTAPAKGA